MEVEAKLIDRLAVEEIKKTCYSYEENRHMFTIGFKQAYRCLTGHTLRYNCSKKCTQQTCSCELPKI